MGEGEYGTRTTDRPFRRWSKIRTSLRAIISGLLITIVAINVWPPLLLNLGLPFAAVAEAIFLVCFLWWTSGGGPPYSTIAFRTMAFRSPTLSPSQWCWGLVAAVFFAVTIHALIVLLFRFVSFPIAAFRHGYDLSFIPSRALRWLAIVVSAISAGICEETGLRGYMQRPLEQQYGAPVAILVSSFFFLALHLNQAWAIPAMVPIVFAGGVLLGLLAWSSRSLIPGMIGHVVMDVGLFAYWWTGTAGNFRARTIAETGIDGPLLIASAVFLGSLSIVLLTIARLRSIDSPASKPAEKSLV
jgi:membrane protease YdiL (CAAX protease family)